MMFTDKNSMNICKVHNLEPFYSAGGAYGRVFCYDKKTRIVYYYGGSI